MFHFFKYLLLVLLFAAFLNIFRSNSGGEIVLKYDIPFIRQWESVPLSVNFLMVAGFSLGILVAAFLGALRMKDVLEKKRELKKLQELQKGPLSSTTHGRSDTLPPLAQ